MLPLYVTADRFVTSFDGSSWAPSALAPVAADERREGAAGPIEAPKGRNGVDLGDDQGAVGLELDRCRPEVDLEGGPVPVRAEPARPGNGGHRAVRRDADDPSAAWVADHAVQGTVRC